MLVRPYAVVHSLKSIYIPKLTEPTWVPSGRRLMDDATLTMKSITCCQLSSEPTLLSRMLPEWSTTNEMSSKHSEWRNTKHHRPLVSRCTLQQVLYSYSHDVIERRLDSSPCFHYWRKRCNRITRSSALQSGQRVRGLFYLIINVENRQCLFCGINAESFHFDWCYAHG